MAELQGTVPVDAAVPITLTVGTQEIPIAVAGSGAPAAPFILDGVPLDHLLRGHTPELPDDCTTCAKLPDDCTT